MMEKPHVCSRDLDSRLQKDKGEGGGGEMKFGGKVQLCEKIKLWNSALIAEQ